MVFYYAEPQYDPEVAAAEAEALAQDPAAAVGVPTLPMFDEAQQQKINEAIAPHVNVELENFQPYLAGTPELELKPEPPLNAQALYQVLDPVVQAVLTDPEADIDALLTAAEDEANRQLAAAQ
jgi:multiple sugar transport system substrate-binding protein